MYVIKEHGHFDIEEITCRQNGSSYTLPSVGEFVVRDYMYLLHSN